MQMERRSADSVLYEPAEFYGQPMLGTGYLVDHATVPEGIHCYDYLHVGDRCLITSERDAPLAEGSVLRQRPLPFGGSQTLDAGKIDHDRFMDEPLVGPERIQEFFTTHTQTADRAVPLPEATQI